MNRKKPKESVADVVASAQRLRKELLDAMHGGLVAAERAAVATELVMLYGQAFREVYDACMRQPSPGALTDGVMSECLCGLALYGHWQATETSISPRMEYMRMTAHWHRITAWVLKEEQ